MFSFAFVLLSVVCLAIGIFLIVHFPRLTDPELDRYGYRSSPQATGTVVSGIVMTIIATLVMLGFIIWGWLVPASSQAGTITSVDGINAKIELRTTLRDEQVRIIRSELIEHYPEYERTLLENLETPTILLSYPELRANETISDAVDQITSLNSSIYDLDALRVDMLTTILHRDRSQWFIHGPGWRSYDDYHANDNPILSPTTSTTEG